MRIDPRRFDGALQIVRLNWPFYAVGAAVLLGWPATPWSGAGGGAVAAAGWLAWSATLWWMAASIAASHWVYDRSKLYAWTWVREILPRTPRRWLNVHAGLDESTEALKALFPASAGVSLDVFDGARMTEPAIQRARRRATTRAVAARHSALPVRDDDLGAVFLLFAAHELRTRSSREELFREIGRVLDRGGRLVLAEHGRDAMNVAAFGPGAWHFLPRAEWLRLARHAELLVETELSITPFVRVWSMSKRVPTASTTGSSAPASAIRASSEFSPSSEPV